jgi:hypothetical protein
MYLFRVNQTGLAKNCQVRTEFLQLILNSFVWPIMRLELTQECRSENLLDALVYGTN